MQSWVALILVWLASSRLVGSILLYQLAWGKAWPENKPGAKTWAWRATLCPEWAFWKYGKEEKGVPPIPVGMYCKR